MKRFAALFLSILFIFTAAFPAGAANNSSAATMQLEKIQGTVTVENASGRSISTRDGMRLYDGYTIRTGAKSYAYISLDSSKALKLDASSKVEVQKSGKKLEISVISGQLFFDVSLPLDKSESLTVRTSTMVTGIRGTSGWFTVTTPNSTQVNLLEGELTVYGTQSVEGTLPQTTITGGQSVTFAAPSSGQDTVPQPAPISEQSIPGFVATAVAENSQLQQRIQQETTLNVEQITVDAQQRLEKE